jgi:hypothetical protein
LTYVNSSSIGCQAKRVTASRTKAELPDFSHSGLSVTPLNPNLLWHADAIIHKDQCFTNRQLVPFLLIGKGSVMSLRSCIFECVHKMGSSEPHSWTQNDRKAISSKLLARLEAEGETLLQIVTSDET